MVFSMYTYDYECDRDKEDSCGEDFFGLRFYWIPIMPGCVTPTVFALLD